MSNFCSNFAEVKQAYFSCWTDNYLEKNIDNSLKDSNSTNDKNIASIWNNFLIVYYAATSNIIIQLYTKENV